MKVLVNKCYGGYGFSNEAHSLYAKKIGKECYFYDSSYDKDRDIMPYKVSEGKGLCVFAFTVPTVDELNEKLGYAKPWHKMTSKERKENSDLYDSLAININDLNRTDKTLISVVEELGKKANSQFSDIRIIDIPDGMEYEISDYDGIETIHEIHQSW